MHFLDETYDGPLERFYKAYNDGLLRDKQACNAMALTKRDVQCGVADLVISTMNQELNKQSLDPDNAAGISCYRSVEEFHLGVEEFTWSVIEDLCMTYKAAPGRDKGEVLAWLPLIDVHAMASRFAICQGETWSDLIWDSLEGHYFLAFPECDRLPTPPAPVERKWRDKMIGRWRDEFYLLRDAVKSKSNGRRNPSHPDPSIYNQSFCPVRIEVRPDFLNDAEVGDSLRLDCESTACTIADHVAIARNAAEAQKEVHDEEAAAHLELIRCVDELVNQVEQQLVLASPGTADLNSMSAQPDGQGSIPEQTDVSSATADLLRSSTVSPDSTSDIALQVDDGIDSGKGDRQVDAPTSSLDIKSS